MLKKYLVLLSLFTSVSCNNLLSAPSFFEKLVSDAFVAAFTNVGKTIAEQKIRPILNNSIHEFSSCFGDFVKQEKTPEAMRSCLLFAVSLSAAMFTGYKFCKEIRQKSAS